MTVRLPLPALLGGEPIRPAGPPDWPGPDAAVELAVHRARGRWHLGQI